MKQFLKNYWPHLNNYLFFITYILFFLPIINGEVSNNNITPTQIILLVIALLTVIGVWVQIIYFMIKAGKNNEINKPLHIILIYMLNLFYIPCFNLTYVQKDKNHIIKNIIYVISSVALFIFMIIGVIKYSITPTYNTYDALNNSIKITVSDKYEIETNNALQIKFYRGVESIVVTKPIGYENATQLLEILGNTLTTNYSTAKLYNSNKKELEDRKFEFNSYHHIYDGYENISTFAVITFKEGNKMILIAQDSLIEEYDEEELFRIFETIELKE